MSVEAAVTNEGTATAGRRTCRPNPHEWRTPQVGDDALLCTACGRAMNFVAEMTNNKYASIANAYRRRRGLAAGEAFGAALLAASMDAKARHAADAPAGGRRAGAR